MLNRGFALGHNLYSKHVYFTNTVQTAPVYFVSEDGSQVIAKFDVNGDLAGKAPRLLFIA